MPKLTDEVWTFRCDLCGAKKKQTPVIVNEEITFGEIKKTIAKFYCQDCRSKSASPGILGIKGNL